VPMNAGVCLSEDDPDVADPRSRRVFHTTPHVPCTEHLHITRIACYSSSAAILDYRCSRGHGLGIPLPYQISANFLLDLAWVASAASLGLPWHGT